MRKKSLKWVTQGALLASLYVVLTYLTSLLGLANGAIQLRLSEALCTLVAFTPIAIPALTLGCFLSNLLTGCLPLDILFGTLATCIGAYLGRLLQNHPRLVPLPTLLANTIVIPLILKYTYGIAGGYLYFVITVGIGEFLGAYLGGMALYHAILPHRHRLFPPL